MVDFVSASCDTYFAAVCSDHAPILLDTDGAVSAGPKLFRFESCWIQEKSSVAVVERAWRLSVQGSASFRLTKRLNATKAALRKWKKENFGVAQVQLKLLKARLHSIQAFSPLDLNWEVEQRIQ